MIKTFNWLVLGNKYEIYLFTKEMKKKKKGKCDRYDMEIFYIECFQKEKNREIQHDVSTLFVSVFFFFFLFVVKLS